MTVGNRTEAGQMTDVPTSIQMYEGQVNNLDLPLAAAGYEWDSEVSGQGDVILVEWTRGDRPPWMTSHPPGEAAPEVVTITANRRGSVELLLYQRCPLESAGEQLMGHTIKVSVSPLYYCDDLGRGVAAALEPLNGSVVESNVEQGRLH
jgi:hypothetical protein